jgi:hypothetical protein
VILQRRVFGAKGKKKLQRKEESPRIVENRQQQAKILKTN